MKAVLDRKAALAGLAGAFAVWTLWLAWVGWLDSDDHRHIDGALGWFREFPYLPQSHGEFRHLVTIPAGLAFRLFGVSEATLILPNLAYYFGTLILTYVWASRAFGWQASLLAIAIMASAPVFAIQASVVFSDITELFFVAVSFWLFVQAGRARDARFLLLISGIAAGCAWLTRETTIALIATYGLVWLRGRFIARSAYVYLGLGFFLVLLAEAAFMFYMTGNPLYRYTEILAARQTFRYHGAVQGDMFDAVGNVHVSRVLDPFLVLFVNHEFGILFILLIPALVWLFRAPRLPGEMLGTARLLALLAAVWFCASAVMLANMHPRYFTVSAYAAAIICALWLIHGVSPRSKTLAALMAAAVLAIGVFAIYLDNRNPLFGERSLKELVQMQPGVVFTDPETARRAGFLLWMDGLQARVSDQKPVPGSIYYYNPNRERDLAENRQDPKHYQPHAQWSKVWQKEEPRRPLGAVLELAGIADKVPPGLYRRLVQPNRQVSAYRVSE